MKNFENQPEVELSSARSSFAGYGHHKITVDIKYKGKEKSFTKTTTDLEALEEAKELGVDSWEDGTNAMYEVIANGIEDQISEWIQEVDFEEEEVL